MNLLITGLLLLSAGMFSPPDSLLGAAWDDVPAKYRPMAESLARNWYEVPTRGNQIDFYTHGRDLFPQMLEDIRSASGRIDMEYYRFADDSLGAIFRTSIIESAARDVAVRLIYDNLINMQHSRDFFRGMASSGVDVRAFSPPSRPFRALSLITHRDHRKIAVMDSRVAYVGGMNISDDYLKWEDLHLRIQGPAVTALEGMFDASWEVLDGTVPELVSQEPLPDGKVVQTVGFDPFSGLYPMMDSYVYALDSAAAYFYARSPYFCPPRKVMKSMRKAVQRGCDVRIILPEKTDVWFMNGANRSYFRRSLRYGIRVFVDEGTFNHSKFFITDDALSVVGTVNLDNRSMKINYEDNIFIYDTPVAVYLRDIFLDQQARCREVTRETIRSWSVLRKTGNGLMRIFVLDL